MNAVEKEFWDAAEANDPEAWKELSEVKDEWEADLLKSEKLRISFEFLCKVDKALGISIMTFYCMGYSSAKLRGTE